MTVDERIRLCRMIEKLNANKAYAQKLGIENRSRFRPNNTKRPSR